MATWRVTRGLAYAWVVALSIIVIGPALLPGFALSYDLVFTPRQDLLPSSIGVGGGLPRAVPQDAVVAVLETVIWGSVLEKIALLAIPVLAGTGLLRLLHSTSAGAIGATFAIVNPFVAQRLVIGHWGFLLAYALVPWGLIVTRRLRAVGDPWDVLRLALIVAAGSLTPSGSLLISVVAVPAAVLPGSRLSPRSKLFLAMATVATWLPWLVPALVHPAVGSVDPDGSSVFSLRPDAPGGPVVSALTGGGMWNAEVVLASRASPLTWLLIVATIVLAALGARRLWSDLGRGVAGWWSLVAVAGLVAGLVSALLPGPWGALVDAIPGAGLARDAHKLLGPWVLLVAAAAGEGGTLLARRAGEGPARVAVAVALAVVPLACQPDMAGGIGGRLAAVQYPSDWSVVREVLEDDSRSGDVASFPWTAFRRFAWNADRTMLDPAPRWLPRTTVVADGLDVSTPGGIVEVDGDDPRAEAIGAALAAGESLSDVLPAMGIGWVLVATGTPGPVPDLAGWELVVDGDDLDLYASSRPAEPRPADHVALVAGVDLAIALGLGLGLGALGFRRVRARGQPRLVP